MTDDSRRCEGPGKVGRMKTVKIRTIEIGSGIPKICVPIVGASEKEILSGADEIKDSAADLVEWRADWYDGVFDINRTETILKELRKILGELPILFTFRTLKEGGRKSIGTEVYVELNRKIVRTGMADLLDVEAFTGDDAVREIIKTAHEFGVKTVASNHDFHKTPPRQEILSRLKKMQEMGADIAKIAVMPQSGKDVLTLLAATEEMVSEYAEIPIITMSMEGTGVLSRISGEVFGSAVTFGCVGRASAPGQMNAGDLKTVLGVLHNGMQRGGES